MVDGHPVYDVLAERRSRSIISSMTGCNSSAARPAQFANVVQNARQSGVT